MTASEQIKIATMIVDILPEAFEAVIGDMVAACRDSHIGKNEASEVEEHLENSRRLVRHLQEEKFTPEATAEGDVFAIYGLTARCAETFGIYGHYAGDKSGKTTGIIIHWRVFFAAVSMLPETERAAMEEHFKCGFHITE